MNGLLVRLMNLDEGHCDHEMGFFVSTVSIVGALDGYDADPMEDFLTKLKTSGRRRCGRFDEAGFAALRIS